MPEAPDQLLPRRRSRRRISAATAGRVKSAAINTDRVGLNRNTAQVAATPGALVSTVFSPFKS
jgi:hypothetical protein